MAWNGFVPALAATFLGAGVGAVLAIPVGLFLDRKQRRRAASKDALQAKSILSEALHTNADHLATFTETLNREGDIVQALLALKLDAETWETVRPLVGEHLPVDVAARLARHFADLHWTERAVEVLVKAAMNPELARAIEHPSVPDDLRSAKGGDPARGPQRAHLGVLWLRQALTARTGDLAKDASDLSERLSRNASSGDG